MINQNKDSLFSHIYMPKHHFEQQTHTNHIIEHVLQTKTHPHSYIYQSGQGGFSHTKI